MRTLALFSLFLLPIFSATAATPMLSIEAKTCGLRDIFTSAFASQVAPHPHALYGDVATNFLAAAAAFPLFANGAECTANKLELSAFWANATQESGFDPSGATLQALFYINELTCVNVDGSIPPSNTIATCAYCQNPSPPPYVACTPSANPAQQYYGRGPLQLSWNYNYQDFNTYIKGVACPNGYEAFGLPASFCITDNYFISNPLALANNGALALAAALWFWNTQKGSAGITPHQAMQQNKGFGYTIKAINGALECVAGAPGRGAAINRGRLFNIINNILGVIAVGPTDCLDLPPINITNFLCGTSYDHALCAPGQGCDGTDASCPSGSSCFSVPGKNVCGATWADAYNQYKTNTVQRYCPDGSDASCQGQTCFAMSTTNFCETNWENACNSSRAWGTNTCPRGLDQECPSGQHCFALPLPGCSSGNCLP